jgi:hypothetical protein
LEIGLFGNRMFWAFWKVGILGLFGRFGTKLVTGGVRKRATSSAMKLQVQGKAEGIRVVLSRRVDA